MSEHRFRLARKLALERLATTAEEDARNCEDEALVWHSGGDANLVRAELKKLAVELRKRIERNPP